MKMRKIRCPGKKLITLLEGLTEFERLDKEPGVGKKKYTIWIGDKTLKGFLEELGITPEEKYKYLVRGYIRKQNILSELHKYGDTKEQISERLKKHVETCQNCSDNYLDMLTMKSNGLLKLLKRPEFKKLEGSREGLFFYLKELDRKYLSLLDQPKK